MIEIATKNFANLPISTTLGLHLIKFHIYLVAPARFRATMPRRIRWCPCNQWTMVGSDLSVNSRKSSRTTTWCSLLFGPKRDDGGVFQICRYAVIYLAYAYTDEKKLSSEKDRIKTRFNDVKKLPEGLSGIDEDNDQPNDSGDFDVYENQEIWTGSRSLNISNDLSSDDTDIAYYLSSLKMRIFPRNALFNLLSPLSSIIIVLLISDFNEYSISYGNERECEFQKT